MAKRAVKPKAPRSPSQPPSAAATPVARRDVLIQAAVVFALAAAARGVHFWLMRDSVFYDVLVCDARQYDRWAQRLTAGDWMGSEVFYQTPLYPYMLGVIYALCGHSWWAVRIVQGLLGSAACVFAARSGAGFFSHRVGWAAGLLLALYPPAIFFDGILQKAALDLVFMTGLLWTLAAAQRQPRATLMALAGLLLGGMTLNRENAAVLVPLLAGWIVWLAWRDTPRTKARYAAAFGLGLALVLLPVGWRNYHVGGQFLVTTSQMGPNFYIGNHAGASGLYEPLRPGRGDPLYESLDARLLAEQDLGRPLSPKEISDYWMRRSWQDIGREPIAWIRLMCWKWLLTWNTAEFADAESIRVHGTDSVVLGGLGGVLHFGVLCPLAAAGIWFTRHEWRRLWVLYAMLAAFAAAVTLFFVFARYRYPLVPVAILFAGAGMIGAWDWYALRGPARLRELGVAAAVAALAAVFCNWPLSHLLQDQVTYITVATALSDEMRPSEALELLKRAVQIEPNSPEAYNNMGCAAINMKRMDEAQAYFQRAIDIDPTCVQAYHGLGELYHNRRDTAKAIALWRRAIDIDPLFAEAYRSLGHAALVAGDHAEAVRLLKQSLSLQDKSVRTHTDLAMAYLARGETALAGEQLRAAIALIPGISEANNLAWILATAPDATLRNADEAVRLADLACRASGYQDPELLDTLAAAKANAGQFDEAVRWMEKAIELAHQTNKPQLVEGFTQRRQDYAQRRPFRDPALQARPDGARGGQA